jgi:hypothetical protein
MLNAFLLPCTKCIKLLGVLMVFFGLLSCNKSNKSAPDQDFKVFLEQISEDSLLQKKRIAWPLKVVYLGLDNEPDSSFYLQERDFSYMDFRIKNRNTTTDSWVQKIEIAPNYSTAKVLFTGIDNGILVEYFFEKKPNGWVLVSLKDAST